MIKIKNHPLMYCDISNLYGLVMFQKLPFGSLNELNKHIGLMKIS